MEAYIQEVLVVCITCAADGTNTLCTLYTCPEWRLRLLYARESDDGRIRIPVLFGKLQRYTVFTTEAHKKTKRRSSLEIIRLMMQLCVNVVKVRDFQLDSTLQDMAAK